MSIISEWADDLRSGHGKISFASGDSFEGEWKENCEVFFLFYF
jgi:hypothetical protein